MAIGFPPKHTQNFILNGISQQQYLVLAIETISKMGYYISYLSENGLIAYSNNGIHSWSGHIIIKIETGIAHINSFSTNNKLLDKGENKKNIDHFIAKYDELKSTYTPEELDIRYAEIKEQLVTQEEDILKLHNTTRIQQIKNYFAIFFPIHGYYVTPILLNLNVILFILFVISGANFLEPNSDSLLNWGANFKPLTLGGQWWRLITNCFLHIGILHLLMNMYALLFIGILLEPYLGKIRFIVAYFLTGLIASIVSLWWHDLTISAGASGAIFGMYGVFLAMLTTNLIDKTARKTQLLSIAVFIVYNLIYGLKGNIDNAAHIGGLISGLFLGYAFVPSLKKSKDNKIKYATILILSILIFISSIIVYKKLPNDIGIYDTKMKEFVTNEIKALEVFKLPEGTPKEDIIKAIKDIGTNLWHENIKLLESFNDLNLPKGVITRNKLLKDYCEYRIESYNLIYYAMSESSDKYNSQIEECNKKIELKVRELSEAQ